MTILVGYPPNRRAKAVLSLAAMLARSSGEGIVVCTVIPAPWIPTIMGENSEYRSYVDEVAGTALKHAREDLPADVSAQFTILEARSIAGGLIEAAEQHNASMIVVGSAMGVIEHVTVSSIADRLLHSAPIPIAVATRGFRATGGVVTRLTLAFSGDEHSKVQVAAAETLATHLGAEFRLASFAVQLAAPAGIRAPLIAQAVLDTWLTAIRAAATDAIRADPASAQRNPGLVIGQGDDWEDALDDIDWAPTDLLVVGSSSAGPLSRVFLGSRATKIIRNTPVPVIAIPRTAAAELAD
jgi:nucleotide-binding universal stress UspA family protein